MPKKSSKTSHVLSLISKNTGSYDPDTLPDTLDVQKDKVPPYPISERIREELEKVSQEEPLEMKTVQSFSAEGFHGIQEEPPLPQYFNLAESLVKSKAIPTMRKLGMCTCQNCTNDVMALALNLLPPKYVVSDTGHLYAKLSSYEKQYAIDLLSAIAKACLQIKSAPRH